MAGLNDDIHDGLDKNFVDPLVDNPNAGNGPLNPPKQSLVVNTIIGNNDSLNKNDNVNLLNPALVPGEVPDLDVKFNLVSEQGAKVVAMKDVEADILGLEAISVGKADDINDVFGGFFSQRLRRNEFSSTPSRTNYAHAVRFMGGRIATEAASFISGAKLASDAALVGYTTFVDSLEKNFRPVAEEKVSDILSTYSNVVSAVAAGISKDVYFFDASKNSVNVLTTPLSVLASGLDAFDYSTVSDSARVCFTTAVRNILQVLEKEPAFANYFKNVVTKTQQDFSMVELATAGANTEVSDVTLSTVFSFFNSGDYAVSFAALQSELQKGKEFFENVNKVLNSQDISFDEAASVVDTNTGAVTYYQNLLKFAVSVANGLQSIINVFNGLCIFVQDRINFSQK